MSEQKTKWLIRAEVRKTISAAIKRAMDIAGAIVGMVVFSLPIVAAVLYIRVTDGGPAIYHQWRVGRGGRLFRIYKLRTMRLDAERHSGAVCALPVDRRVIPGCRWMRSSHFDELAQLWNILRGDMSLVGPRPERPELMDSICENISNFESRLAVRPGLTGLAQVRSGYANNLRGHRRKLHYDMLYMRRIGTLTDLRLMGSTLFRLWDHAAN